MFLNHAIARILTSIVVLAVLCPAASSRAALVGYWDFNGDLNNRAAGSVGAMELFDNAQLSSAQVAPSNGGSHSLLVDGDTDYAYLDSGAGRAQIYSALSGNFTVSAWGRSDVAAAASGKDLLYLWDIGEAHGHGAGTFFASGHGVGDNGEIGAYYNDNTGIRSDLTGDANTWYHVVLTGDGTNVRLYVDGDEKGSRSQNVDFSDYRDFRVGAEAKSGTRAWEGYLDDVAVWNHTLSAQEVAHLHDGTITPFDTSPQLGEKWAWEDQIFDDSHNPGGPAVGPWIHNARWRYKSDNGDTDTVWDDATLDDFPDLDHLDSSAEWQMSASQNYPQVRTSDASMHTGHTASNTEDYDIVTAWEADFTGHVTVDYRAGSGNTIGYQLLQWDASAGRMRVLKTRETYAGTGFGPLHELTRVEPGDQILVVLDGNGDSGDSDRIHGFSETITMTGGPAMGTQWDFQADMFDDTSITTANGPWENAAHWRYMMNDRSADDTYNDLSGMIEFETLSGTRWQMYASDWPDVQLDGTVHPGDSGSPDPDTNAIVAWEADFAGAVEIDYSLASGTVGYQLLQWDASAERMLVLQARDVYSGASGELFARAGIEPGDMLLWIVDNDGSYGGDRVTFNALITAVPEPSAAALALLGLVGTIAFRRRRVGE